MKNYSRVELQQLPGKSKDTNKVTLMSIATELKITGRHKMNKETMVNEIWDIIAPTPCDELPADMVIAQEETEQNAVEESITMCGEISDTVEEDAKEYLDSLNRQVKKPAQPEVKIITKEVPRKLTSNERLRLAELGTILAFTIGDVTISGRLVSRLHDDMVEIITKMGSTFEVPEKNVVWVKTGKFWPKFVMQAFNAKQVNNDEQATE